MRRVVDWVVDLVGIRDGRTCVGIEVVVVGRVACRTRDRVLRAGGFEGRKTGGVAS